MYYLINIIIICFAIQLLYTLFFIISNIKIRKLHHSVSILEDEKLPVVTILICAKNEYKHLKKFLNQILRQEYPSDKIQFLIVNDGSTDESFEFLEELKEKNTQLTIIHIDATEEKSLPGKKFALKYGIELVNTEYVLLTDADCFPTTLLWVKRSISAIVTQQSDALLGLGRYQFESNNWLNAFIQFETLHTAIQYASYSFSENSYMGVGRNILYKTSIIQNALQDEELLEQFKKTSSGDDDLLITYLQKKKKKILPYFHPEAQTVSKAENNLQAYFTQKSRHTSSSKYYTFICKLSLLLYAFSHALFWLSGLLIIYYFLLHDNYTSFERFVFGSFMIVLILKFVNYQMWVTSTKYAFTGILYLVLEPIWLLYNVILTPYIFWKNTFKWK